MAAGAAGLWASGVGGSTLWAVEAMGWERSANITAATPTTATMVNATTIWRDFWELI